MEPGGVHTCAKQEGMRWPLQAELQNDPGALEGRWKEELEMEGGALLR